MSKWGSVWRRPANSLRARFALLIGISGVLLGIVVIGILEWKLESYTLDAQQRELKVVANEISDRLAKDIRSRSREISLTGSILERAHISQPDAVRDLLEKLKEEQNSYA